MGKKLIVDYTFDASAKTITVNDIYSLERFQLITNVTDNIVIMQFNDPAFGITNISFDYDNSKTTITLAYDTTSMSDTDSLQIFLDQGVTEIDLEDRFIDPVSKIRVSNPENLIDTDFEYGLQSTKWETLELTANIPTFFSRSGDFDIQLVSMQISSNSDIVTVTTSVDHQLQRGSPIIMQGSGQVAADGGFVVNNVLDDTTFTYKAKSIFQTTADIKEEFTQLFPGSVYMGTEFKLSNIAGITTDGTATSELTVNTQFPTDFEVGTSMALSNTFAKATVEFSTDNVTVDNVVTTTQSYTSATATGESNRFELGGVKAWHSMPKTGLYFEEGSGGANNLTLNGTQITFPYNHNLVANDILVYLADNETNTPMTVTGTNLHDTDAENWAYRVDSVIDSTTIVLETVRGRVCTFTAGSSGGITKSCFAKCLGYTTYYYGRYRYGFPMSNSGSWANSGGWYAKYGTTRVRYHVYNFNDSLYAAGGILHSEINSGLPGTMSTILQRQNNDLYDYWAQYYTTSSTSSFRNTWRAYYSGPTGSTYIRSTYSRSGYNAILDIEETDERSSLWLPNHGLATGDRVTVTATSGFLPTGLTSGSTYIVDKVDDNRIAFKDTSGTIIFFTSFGSTNLVYQVVNTKIVENANKIHIPNTTLSNGDLVTYNVNSGTAIGGLVDGTNYFVAGLASDRFYFSTTKKAFGDTGTIVNQGSASYVNETQNQVTLDISTLSTGDAVLYTSTTPLGGLVNGAVYWVRQVSGATYTLHNSKADANSNSNIIDIERSSGTGTLQEYTIVDITSRPASNETQKLIANFIGAADGNYTVSGVAADQNSFTFEAGEEVTARTITFTTQQGFIAELNAFYFQDHGLITGDSVTYTTSGTTNLTGLTDSTTYYVVAGNKDLFRLATSEANAIADTPTVISLTETSSSITADITGTHTFTPTTIVGRFTGKGTLSFDASATVATGELTTFTSYFNSGDKFEISIPETNQTATPSSVTSNVITCSSAHNFTTGDAVIFSGDVGPAGSSAPTLGNIYFVQATTTNNFATYRTRTDALAGLTASRAVITDVGTNVTVTSITSVGEILDKTIDYVNSDEQIQFTTALPATAQTDVSYLQRTSLLLRPDGFALHRPYDGGVELIPPTNPDSTMIRQTRKYFRYQSGKGIQVSFAVNFSPTSQIDTFSRSGTTGTIKTRFPHRLSAGLNITVSGSTNPVDTLGTINKTVTVGQDTNYNNVYYIDSEYGSDLSVVLYEGRTYRFDQSDSTNAGHPLRFSTTADGTHGSGTEYTTGVTTAGTPGSAGAYTEITVATGAPTLYAYCTNHSGMGFEATTPTDPNNNQVNLWNGVHEIASVIDDFTFTVTLDGTPANPTAQGVVEYYVNGWANSALRCGLYDDQNGIFFEYDGDQLHCCRRSSIKQLSGYANVTFRSGTINGVDTKFSSQLVKGDMIVVKGQSYVVTKIDSDTKIHIAPSYRGITLGSVVITKTETTKVPQPLWNLDKCDGTGYTGFKLDINKIQMAYVDYSWYGAGKVRFGFKDQHGDVRYIHSFVHGNFFTEAYMRSGNIPARYEIQNTGTPTYVPALAHWGTSVIMDGRFDPDKAYIFNATSNNLVLTGASQLTADGNVAYNNLYYQRLGYILYPIGYAIELDAPSSSLSSSTQGTVITGADLATSSSLADPQSSEIKPFQPYLPSILCRRGTSRATEAIRDLLLIDKQPTGTTSTVSTYNIGAASGGEVNVTKDLPLISIRLAPSVDTSAPGFLGEREIINRMQLILNSVGVLSTHAAEIKLVLNGQLSTNVWERVTNPSLSQLINHVNTDIITGGLSVYNFEAQGGSGTSARQPVLTTESLGEIATLGNSIMGGDNVYPDGPDVLTMVAKLSEDPSTVSETNPFIISGRISWSESQA